MSKAFKLFGIVLTFMILALPSQDPRTLFAQAAQQGARSSSIEDRTAGMQKIDGYFPLYWEERTGTLFLEIPRFNSEFLFTTGLSAGLGSNDIGLDRGESGQGRVVQFQRVGPKILLVQGNQSFRSTSPNPAERKSVEDSFGKSILWGFTVAAETGDRVLVDASDFLLRDIHGAAGSLRPGNYRIDRTRSVIYMPRTKAFPKNTEIETMLTFVNDGGGGGRGGGGGGGGLFSGTVASVAPNADNVTLREHVSLVELPEPGFKARKYDPRSGFGNITYVDYSTPIGDPMQIQVTRRHRLEKKDPSAASSEAVKPIRYWVDSGAPEDVKTALVQGASWWAEAFTAAGFINGFKVDVLPADADPMDIRYNMINWVHRSTRGWSSGGGVTDPRTGEIIKAVVTLGSLRDRQDYMIFEGLLSPYSDRNARATVPYEAALKRIRQLSAHEVGHTLGLGHNYYSSSKGWISVMDYPHPFEKLTENGTIDLSEAYPQRIGDWDKVAINYGYRQMYATPDDPAVLAKILNDAWAQDVKYMTATGLHPRVDTWSNGVNQADELTHIMKVRRAALDRIGENTIRAGVPMALIEEPLVTTYMYHRYSVDSAANSIGGQDYVLSFRGDGRTPVKPVPAADQLKALEALAATLKPSELTIPKPVLDSLPPRPPGFGMHRELFPRTTGEAFDPLSPAAVAADVTIGAVLQPVRAARLVAQHAVDASLPSLEQVIDRLTKATFEAETANTYEAEVRRTTERALVDRLTSLASTAPNAQVRAIASLKLSQLSRFAEPAMTTTDADRAQRTLMAAEIKRFLDRPAGPPVEVPGLEPPPGAPIGDTGHDWLALPPR